MKKIILFSLTAIMIVSIVASFSLIGCKTEEAVEEEVKEEVKEEEAVEEEFDPADHLLGYVIWNKTHPVVQIFIAGFMSKAKELGYPAKVYGPVEPDMEQVLSMGEAGIAEGASGMMIYGAFGEAIWPFMEKAADAGIAVVDGQSYYENESDMPKGVLAWAATKPLEDGASMGKLVGEKIDGKGTIALSQGSFNPVENDRMKGFIDYMEANYPDVKLLDVIEEGFDPAEAESKATAVLLANTDTVAVWSTTGAGAMTWSNAAAQAGRDDLIITSLGVTEQSLDLIESGEVFAILDEMVFEIFARDAELLDLILRGEDYPVANLIPADIVTADNLAAAKDKMAMIEIAVKEMDV